MHIIHFIRTSLLATNMLHSQEVMTIEAKNTVICKIYIYLILLVMAPSSKCIKRDARDAGSIGYLKETVARASMSQVAPGPAGRSAEGLHSS